jgi:translation initiation factor IF-3
MHADRGREVLERLSQFIGDVAVIERPARLEGRNMIMILAPKQ